MIKEDLDTQKLLRYAQESEQRQSETLECVKNLSIVANDLDLQAQSLGLEEYAPWADAMDKIAHILYYSLRLERVAVIYKKDQGRTIPRYELKELLDPELMERFVQGIIATHDSGAAIQIVRQIIPSIRHIVLSDFLKSFGDRADEVNAKRALNKFVALPFAKSIIHMLDSLFGKDKDTWHIHYSDTAILNNDEQWEDVPKELQAYIENVLKEYHVGPEWKDETIQIKEKQNGREPGAMAGQKDREDQNAVAQVVEAWLRR